MNTGAHPRVYVARLAGMGVFDAAGDQVGKVRDVVVALRYDTSPPRALGLVVEVAPRRRIFVPMTRVSSLDAGTAVVSGLVNLRRFEQRQNETLVIAELFDRKVTVLHDSSEATVVDVALEQDRTQDWHVTRLFVRSGGSGFRRRTQTQILSWREVRGLTLAPVEGQGVDGLLATMDNLRPADLANVMQDLPEKRRMEVARELDDERLADVLEELPEDDRVGILAVLEAERAADVLEEMDPDDAADLLSELPPERADELLAKMEPDDAADLRRLLSYGDYTGGGMMNPEPVILGPDSTVAEALARIRNPEVSPSLAAQVYVARPPLETPTGRFLGVVHFQRLLREAPGTLVAGIMDKGLAPVGPEAPLGELTRFFATYNLVAVPIVDSQNRLLGAVTVDDLVDHMLPEDWRDNDGGGVRG